MLVASLLLQLAVAPAAPDTAPVEAAIVAAVRARMGDDADVQVDDLQVPERFTGVPVQARLDPGARLGGIVRVNLARVAAGSAAPPAYTGSARAVLRVTVPHLHARRAIARGEDLTAANVVVVEHALEAGAIEPRPGAALIGTSRAGRALAGDSCLTRASLVTRPAVQAGQEVEAIARVGGVEAVARLVAADRGDIGAIVRVVNPEGRRSLKARVVAAGIVEVIHD